MGENAKDMVLTTKEGVKKVVERKNTRTSISQTIAIIIDYAKYAGPLYAVRGDTTYVYKDKTYNLGRKVEYVREKYKRGELSPTEIMILEKIGMDWRNAKPQKKHQDREM